MARERVQVGARVDRDVYESFKGFTREHCGQVRGELGRMLENAMEEYMDNDRHARIESRLDEVLARLDDLDATHTHKHSETVAKVEQIAESLYGLDRTVISNDDVRRAIEDTAGADDRTLEKYREQLKRRGLAYKHPTDKVWFVERDAWIKAVESYLDNNPTAELHDVLASYPLDVDEYERAVEREVLA